MDVKWIDKSEQLIPIIERFSQLDRVAVDLEGDGIFRYRARLCVLQLASVDEIILVDTLAVDPLEHLGTFLSASGPLKVMHDMSFDARLLRDHGIILGSVFDTSISARFLGEKATGLSSLISSRVGVKLKKEHQMADWGARPLSKEKLEYLASDVRYLFQLHDSLVHDMEKAGIVGEVFEETLYALERGTLPVSDPGPGWVKMKGARDLRPGELAVLRQLALTREELAMERNVPPARMLNDRLLLLIARKPPKDIYQFRRLRELSNTRNRELVKPLFQAVERGRSEGEVPVEEMKLLQNKTRTPDAEKRRERRKMEEALRTWRKSISKSLKLNSQVVLPGHCLRDLLTLKPKSIKELRTIPGIGKQRVEKYGEQLLHLFNKDYTNERHES
jgi:ribonuclease D